MSDLIIESVPVPSENNSPMDDAPPSTHEYACLTCGTELHYGGKGRKPKYCDAHKPSRSPSRRTTGPKNEQLAAQATEALIQINGLASLGLLIAGLPLTATAIDNAKDGLREQLHAALITDPALCRTILRAGSGSAKLSLAVAYGMLAVSVVPVGVAEVRAKRAAAQSADEEGYGDV